MSTPIADHVHVDHQLHGCPIDRHQLLALLARVVADATVAPSPDVVCLDCKARGAVCVVVAHGATCLGPMTRAGCGALCPSFARGCYGCFGPTTRVAGEAMVQLMRRQGVSTTAIQHAVWNVNAWAPETRSLPTAVTPLTSEPA